MSLVVVGTGSDVGKSILTTAFCRLFRDRGLDVAPFKAQNMSNNAGVTDEGLELARAQIVQAEAARVAPTADMNPVLIKPTSDRRSQVILGGRVLGNTTAAEYFRDTSMLRKEAFAALDRLRARHSVIVAEGAGSCAEVNLRARDFTNLDVAHHLDAPAVLVADIDRGGVFAQVVGTLAVLDARDRARLTGVIINRFRGDLTLFADGVRYLERHIPVLGVVPFLRGLGVESEDALPLDATIDPPPAPRGARVRVGVVLTPHIANFTDFAALGAHPEVEVHYLSRPRDLATYDLVLLAGSKNTRRDLEHLWSSGWAGLLTAWHGGGGQVGGICGGYQMLGREVADPLGVESDGGVTPGLGLLPVATTLTHDKVLGPAEGRWAEGGIPVSGYEIHCGRTVRAGGAPLLEWRLSRDMGDGWDGARSEDGRAWGTYLHGLFDTPALVAHLLAPLRPDVDLAELGARPSFRVSRDAAYDRLAAHVGAHVDVDRLGAGAMG